MRSRGSTLRWLYRIPGKKKWYIAILTVVQAVHGASGVLYALLLRNVVDCAVQQNRNGFWQAAAGIALLVIGQIGLEALSRWMSELARATFENLFKEREAETIFRKNYAAVCMTHSGEWMNRLTNDTAVVANSYVEILPGFAGVVVKLLSALALLLILSPSFFAILLAGGLLISLLTYVLGKKLKNAHKQMQKKDGEVRIFLQERINSLLIIKSFAAEGKTLREGMQKMSDHLQARMKKNHLSNFCNTGLALMIESMYLLGVCFCAWGILLGTVSYGTLTAVMQLLGQIQKPFVSISGYLPKCYAMLASAERLMEAESFPEDNTQALQSKEEIAALYNERLVSFGMHNADYTYNPVEQEGEYPDKSHMPVVLHNVNIEIRKGEYTAFTGPSGCGKSTMLKLLMSMYPLDNGTRSILCRDGTEIPLTAEYRRLFAYVPQGNMLMTGTIREIAAFSDEGEPDEARIRNALEIACASGFVDELENGIDTSLGERGSGLSEGQMQRIAIARAIYSEAPVLLLDEATSALDAETEKKLLFNLREMTNKTVVIVTHRPAALEICDHVLEFTERGVEEV